MWFFESFDVIVIGMRRVESFLVAKEVLERILKFVRKVAFNFFGLCFNYN